MPREPVRSPNLQQAGGQDRRRGEQEGEMRRVLVVQAADEPGRHAHSVAADPGYQGRGLSHSDDARFAIFERVQPAAPIALHALAGRQCAHLRAAAQAFGAEQDDAVDDQEDRRRQRFGQGLPNRALEQQTQDPHRDRRADDQPRQPLGRCLDPPLVERPEERRDDRDPLAPEVDEQPDRATDVEHDHEGQPRRFGLGLPGHDVVPPEQVGEDHRVTEARDREQLGHSLEHAEHDRLTVGDEAGREGDHKLGRVARRLTGG